MMTGKRTLASRASQAMFTGEPQSHDMPVLANPHWNPLWECAQAHDLPISFHIGAGNFTGEAFWTPERVEHYGSGGVNGMFTTGLFLDIRVSAAAGVRFAETRSVTDSGRPPLRGG